MRIPRGQHVSELVVEFGDRGLEFGDLVGERRVIGGKLAGRLQIAARGRQLAVGGGDGRQLGEALTHPPGIGGVAVQFRV